MERQNVGMIKLYGFLGQVNPSYFKYRKVSILATWSEYSSLPQGTVVSLFW